MIPRAGLLCLLEVLDRLKIAYMVAGSTASSIYGFYRATADVDLVIRLEAERVDEFVALVHLEFYVDAEQIHSAIRFRRAFNVIHLQTAYKFDLFPLPPGRYSTTQFARRQFQATGIFGGEPIEMALASPEDIILNKLIWYRQGGRISDRQWSDILGVVAVKRSVLDLAYLRQWAGELGLTDLLESALAELHGD